MTDNAFGSLAYVPPGRAGGVTHGLAAMQKVTLRRFGTDNLPGPTIYSKTDLLMTASSDEGDILTGVPTTEGQWAGARRSTVAFRDEHRQRAIAEIEQAYVALRRAEPALDPWQQTETDANTVAQNAVNQSGTPPQTPKVWLLIGGIWLATTAAVGAAIAAMVYLLG